MEKLPSAKLICFVIIAIMVYHFFASYLVKFLPSSRSSRSISTDQGTVEPMRQMRISK
jgi:hypothetical protein